MISLTVVALVMCLCGHGNDVVPNYPILLMLGIMSDGIWCNCLFRK